MELNLNLTIKNYLQNQNFQKEKALIGGVNVEKAYIVKTENQDFILKSVRKDHIAEVTNAASITQLLQDNGFDKTTQNLTTLTKAFVYTDENNVSWELQKYIQGKHINTTDLTEPNIESLAQTLAQLHKTFLSQPKPALDYLNTEVTYSQMFDGEQHEKTQKIFDTLDKHNIPDDDKNLLTAYWTKYNSARNEIITKLQGQEEILQKSIIHRDLNKGNILFDPEGNFVVAFVDWDTAMWGNILQDVCYLSSHYLISKKDGMIDIETSKKHIQLFVNKYQENIKFNHAEKLLFVTLVDILLVRATRWWIKRYVELATIYAKSQQEVDKTQFEGIRGGFRSTLENWINNRNASLELFSLLQL